MLEIFFFVWIGTGDNPPDINQFQINMRKLYYLYRQHYHYPQCLNKSMGEHILFNKSYS